MKTSAPTNDYEALIDDQRSPADSIAQRREAARLEEIAQNLASLGRLVEAEARERARGGETISEASAGGRGPGPLAAPSREPVPPEGTPGGTQK